MGRSPGVERLGGRALLGAACVFPVLEEPAVGRLDPLAEPDAVAPDETLTAPSPRAVVELSLLNEPPTAIWLAPDDAVRAALKAEGGGDEPESLLDALFKAASMEASPKGSQTEDPNKWRYRSDAARVIIVFTDASFKETMSIQEAKGGSLQDVANVIMANRIILSLFAPNFEGYDRLSQIDKSEWEVVEYEGLSPQEALKKFTSDPVSFRTTLKQLAASVSRSAETVAL